jgi:hypothetical protein
MQRAEDLEGVIRSPGGCEAISIDKYSPLFVSYVEHLKFETAGHG